MKYILILIICGAPLSAQEDVLIGIAVMDVITTHYIATTGGQELNPLVPANDLPAYVAIKAVLIAAYLNTKPPKRHIWLMNILTSTGVINNLYQIHRRQ